MPRGRRAGTWEEAQRHGRPLTPSLGNYFSRLSAGWAGPEWQAGADGCGQALTGL